MPKINFDDVPDNEEFEPVPANTYLCRLDNVKEDKTKDGDVMFRLEFEIVDGDYKDRKIFDNMVFSQKAYKRVKLICSRLGVPVEGEIDVTPDLLMGRRVYLDVTVDHSYVNPETGKKVSQNKVPFAGYHRAEEKQAVTDEGPDGCPF